MIKILSFARVCKKKKEANPNNQKTLQIKYARIKLQKKNQ